MIHSCNLNRCKKGDPTARCKYGFPKKQCSEIHETDDGEIMLKRGSSDAFVVDYSPYFLLKWQGHCHVHILKTEEHPLTSPNAIFYIVKYNFKSEPNLKIQYEENNTNFRTLFHGRVVSVEDAISKIFSYEHYGCDLTTKYISLQPPEERKAAYRNNVQVQITNIDKYFNRPVELERIGILSFFSMYDIIPSNMTNREKLKQIDLDKNKKDPKVLIKPKQRLRPKGTLSEGSSWEKDNLQTINLVKSGCIYPSQDLPNAKSLICKLRTNAQIIITEKFNLATDVENFAYTYLLINGCWRSDVEMKAGQNSWFNAVLYHGLIIQVYDDEMAYNRLLINYMLNSPRYSALDITRNISMMKENMNQYIDSIYQSASVEQKKILDVVKESLKCRNELEINDLAVTNIREPPNLSVINKYIHFSFTDLQKHNSNSELQTSLSLFNKEQKYIYDEITSRIKGGIQTLAFICGKAGTGKTFLINTLQNFFISQSIPYLICASTGIAASIIHGKTVHSAFGLYSIKEDKTENVLCSLDVSKENGYSITFAQVIIIDEITMISSAALEAIDHGLKKLAAQMNNNFSNQTFGGKHILLFGDLAQVPAVTQAKDDYNESILQFHQSVIFDDFNRWSLNQIMRQDPNEVAFLQLLDYIRNHNDDTNIDQNIKDLLKTKFIPGEMEKVIDQVDNFVGNDDPNGMVITFTNRTASEYNSIILRKRPNFHEHITLNAKFYIRQDSSHLSNINKFNENDEFIRNRSKYYYYLASEKEISIFCGAMKKKIVNTIIPFNLTIAPNCRIMLLQNLDLNSGLINGARGTFIRYLQDLDSLEIKFDFQQASENPILIQRKKSIEYQIENGKVIFMYQFPIKLSWAVTAHKSQGQTLSKVAIHIGEYAFAHGSFYVALSRVKSLDNIILFGRTEWPDEGPIFHVNPYIQHAQELQADNE